MPKRSVREYDPDRVDVEEPPDCLDIGYVWLYETDPSAEPKSPVKVHLVPPTQATAEDWVLIVNV